jgi:hypothetical protein
METRELFKTSLQFLKEKLLDTLELVAHVIWKIEKMETIILSKTALQIVKEYALDYLQGAAEIIWKYQKDLNNAKPFIETFLLNPVLKIPVEQLPEFQQWLTNRNKPKKIEVVEPPAASATPSKKIEVVEPPKKILPEPAKKQ